MADISKINDIDYEFEFKLSNADKQEIKFTKSAVRGMTIKDSIFNPFIEASISIANPYDFIEKDYLLRGDGRDTFKIMIKPVEGSADDKLEYEFVVVEDKDVINPEVRSENMKTLLLLDKNQVPFMEEIPYNKVYSGKVGDIIKDIIKELLGDDIIDEENWESGDFSFDYAPPLSWRYIDFLYYLLQLYYFKDDDLYVKAFLHFDNKDKKYKLVPISKFFTDNKKQLLESFGLGDLTETIDFSNPNNPPPDGKTGEYIGPMKNLGYSTPMFLWNNDFFINYLVYRYDEILGEFKIRKLLIDDVLEKWKVKFVDVFKSIGGEVKPFMVMNKKTSKKFKHYNVPFKVEDSVKMVESELYNIFTFYNLQCSFSNIGDSSRHSGKFIDIFKTKNDDLKSDEKILGRWLVTEVSHVFFADLYRNEISCCKTYVGPNNKINNDVD